MKLSFLGAAHEVTGSCTLLTTCGKNILIDCGMEQGPDIYENCDLPIVPSEIDCLLLTHAHIDHSGKVPALTALGYDGPIYSTEATRQLCQIMLLDSAHIQSVEAEWQNRKAKRSGREIYKPLYTENDVYNTLDLFYPMPYNKSKEIFEGISIRFIDAGHLLGSSSIEITVREGDVEKVILFSGDVGNIDRPLIRNPQRPEKADIVIVESTYGDRVHGERKDYKSQLVDIIQSTFDCGGNLVIPSFAIGRTQELLYLIHKIKAEKLIKNHGDFPVWLDSPLAVEATEIYRGDMGDYYDEEALEWINRGENILTFKGLNMSITSDESKAINFDNTPKIIISSSGMCEAGRIRHHLKHNLWREDSTILFVGYQSEGTLGRIIIDGAPTVKLFGEDVRVRARIAQMDGISGHADKNMLLEWLGSLKNTPDMVFVNHGNDNVCDRFAAEITEKLGFSAVAPYNGAEYNILTETCIAQGNTKRLEKRHIISKKTSAAFESLLAAGKRLLAIIEKNRGRNKKDLAKFANQVNSLCDKWNRR